METATNIATIGQHEQQEGEARCFVWWGSSTNDDEDKGEPPEKLSYLLHHNLPKSSSSSSLLLFSKSNDEDSASIFTVVTWNIWFSQYYWLERLCVTLLETLVQQPDVFCFQEVTQHAHNGMMNCTFLRQHYEPTETTLPHSYDCAIWVRKDLAATVDAVQTIPLPSIYGRRGLCVDISINKKAMSSQQEQEPQLQKPCIRVISTHLESGKGMAATRRAQLQALKEDSQTLQDDKNNRKIPTFLVGDFNLDPSYPENEAVPGLDLWSHCFSSSQADQQQPAASRVYRRYLCQLYAL